MKRTSIIAAYLSLFLVTGCTCRPEVEGFALYDSSIRHSDTAPARFTVLNKLGRFSTSTRRGADYVSSSELRPEYSEVYVFDETKECSYYNYEESDCPVMWKALTHPDRSPWQFTYGEEGEHLATAKHPRMLVANSIYRVVVALREPNSNCVSEVGSHKFSFRQDGRILPVDKNDLKGYVPIPDPEEANAAQQLPAVKERLNRLAKQYEKINGHPLLPLSFGEEISPEMTTPTRK